MTLPHTKHANMTKNRPSKQYLDPEGIKFEKSLRIGQIDLYNCYHYVTQHLSNGAFLTSMVTVLAETFAWLQSPTDKIQGFHIWVPSIYCSINAEGHLHIKLWPTNTIPFHHLANPLFHLRLLADISK